MRQIRDLIHRAGIFFSEVAVEFRRTSWPQRRELTESTVAVIVFIALLALFIMISDRLILSALRMITGAG